MKKCHRTISFFVIFHVRESHFSLYVMQKRCHAILNTILKKVSTTVRWPFTSDSVFLFSVSYGIHHFSACRNTCRRRHCTVLHQSSSSSTGSFSTQTLWLSIRLYPFIYIYAYTPQCDQHIQYIYYSPYLS